MNITSSPSTVSDQAFEVGVFIEGPSDGINYLRIDMFKDGSNNYFGETYNGNDWFGGSDGKSYYPVEIKNSTASATIKGRLGNPTLSEYSGPGTYKLKLRRYTASGNAAGSDSQTVVDIQIEYLLQTPSPTPATNPVQTSIPTKVPTPTPLASKSPTSKPTIRPSITPTPSEEPEVLGEETETTPPPFRSPEPPPTVEKSEDKDFPVLAGVLIGTGLIFVFFSGFMIVRNIRKNRASDDILTQ